MQQKPIYHLIYIFSSSESSLIVTCYNPLGITIQDVPEGNTISFRLQNYAFLSYFFPFLLLKNVINNKKQHIFTNFRKILLLLHY